MKLLPFIIVLFVLNVRNAEAAQPPFQSDNPSDQQNMDKIYNDMATHHLKSRDVIPDQDSTRDLGQSGREWAGVFVDTVTISGSAPASTAQNAVYAEMTPKVMARMSSAQTIDFSVNVTSATDLNCPSGCGRINFTRPFSSTNYYVSITPQDQATPFSCTFDDATLSVSSVDVICRNTSTGALGDVTYFVMVFGKQ